MTSSQLEVLRSAAEQLRQRINRLRLSLGRFFVDKQEIIDLMVVAAVAQEPLLIVGAPGTAKSDLVVKFKDAIGVRDDEYFEYMLTRFTEPSEILGPVDLNALRKGEYIKREEGRLPTARVAFLDEIFQSNSAILNVLLTIINERKIYQDGGPRPIPLQILFAASNDIPDLDELAALRDRFPLKIATDNVQDEWFDQLIDCGVQGEGYRAEGRAPWREGQCTLDDLVEAGRYLALVMAERRELGDRVETDRDRYFPKAVYNEFSRIVQALRYELDIAISDRRLIRVYKLLRVRAWLLGGGTVSHEDLTLLQYVGDSREQLDILRDRVPKMLDLEFEPSAGAFPVRGRSAAHNTQELWQGMSSRSTPNFGN